MRPVTVTVPASAASPVIPLDLYEVGPVGWQLSGLTGGPSVTIQYTFDDVYATTFNPATANWLTAKDGAAVVAAAGERLADANGNPVNPTAVRGLNANAASSATLRIVQSGLRA